MMLKPIPFNTAMVKAILDGRKTETRRLIKPQPLEHNHLDFCIAKWKNEKPKYYDTGDNQWACECCGAGIGPDGKSLYHAPYQVGDILYVRETWQLQSMRNFDKRIKFLFKAEPNNKLQEIYVSPKRYTELMKFSSKNGWQPSLFMPKEAARLFLKVTEVRAERVQDITEDGARREGCIDFYDKTGNGKFNDVVEFDLTARDAFGELWNSTIKKQDIGKYDWNSNPWAWVIKFKQITKEAALSD